MNKDKLKNIISKKANGNSKISQQLYQMYFFEHILERISKSKYKHNIILKGGLLLSSIIGNDERTTKDMDATLKSIPLQKEEVKMILEEILEIDVNDNITYKVIDIKDIRKESEYGGFKLNILAMMENLKVYLAIEFTTGDKITPREVEYNYNCQFENKKIPILAYTLETIIAEKYHAIIDKNVYNTRMKDFYDISMILNEKNDNIDKRILKQAIINTFKHRETPIIVEDIKEELEDLKMNISLKKLWQQYQLTAPYAKDIIFEDIFSALEDITALL